MKVARINGVETEVDGKSSILEAARAIGFDIPTLCNDERIKACGACRMCIVAVEGRHNPVASCMTPLEEGMSIETDVDSVRSARAMYLKMLAKDYPAEAFINFPEKQFHRLAAEHGLDASDFKATTAEVDIDRSHTYIDVDMSRCIDCFRCVRICDELQGQFVWTVVDRGQGTSIVPDNGGDFGSSSCVSCGACVDSCPTGALEDKSVVANGHAQNWTKTVCPYCGTGCEMMVGTKEDRIIQVTPSEDSDVSKGHLCVKGRYAFGFVDAPDRVTEPMIRVDGDWKTVSWDEAIDFTVSEMKRLISEHGAESIAVLGSARATNEENYVTQKFVRAVLKTNNVDCCARVCHTPTAAAMKLMLGTGAATNSFDDIEMARTILVVGANPTENHPIPGARMKQAKLRGANLIVIDPRKTELAEYADVHLQLKPGTNIALMNSIAFAIIDEGLADETFIRDRVEEFEEFKDFVSKFRPEDVAGSCGVSAEDIRRAARLYARETPSISFHGLGVTEHFQGTEGVMCVVNLALITGNIGKRGAGVNPLRGQNNVQGSAHMGCDPGVLTGGISVDEGREHFESVWGVPIPESKGYNQLQMMDAAHSGKLKALWTIGYDVFLSNANSHRMAESFRNLELVIVQDMFMNETAKHFGTVFLPAASSFEKLGTFMNAERRIQLIRPSVSVRGNSKTDWEIVCEIGAKMGSAKHFGFSSSEEIWNEIRAVWPNAAGITYSRLEHGGLQWNCPTEDHPGTEILHEESFAKQKTATLRRIDFKPTKEKVSEEFPFILTTGRSLYHFNAGTMTERTPNLEIRPSDLLDICPSDAATIGVCDGEKVRLKSAHGEAIIPVRINPDVKTGEMFATFHSPEIFLNYVTSPVRDRFVSAPEYKVTAVKVEKIR